MADRIVVFATSFLDELATHPNGEHEGKQTLERLEEESEGRLRVEYRCDRDPQTALDPSELSGVRGVIADLERYDRSLLSQVGAAANGDLEIVARYGVGFDSIDVEAAKEYGVTVTNAPGANSRPTAEWAVATLLDIAGRRIPQHERASRGLGKSGPSRLDVTGRTLGVIGTGTIGRIVVELLSGFGMRILAYDPYPDAAWAERVGAQYVPLEELVSGADFVTIHAAAKERILGAPELAMMKPTAALVNCARGVHVDNRAAHEAVRDGRLFGYGIDEIWPEPDLSLEGLNIAASPHVGSDTDSGKVEMRRGSARNIVEHFLGNGAPNPVN
jgi:D-3-phosphoglycerate dehydrogenase